MIKNAVLNLLLFCASGLFAQNKSIILGRPTDTSMTASILFDQAVQFYLEYGTRTGVYAASTAVLNNVRNVPDEIDMRSLTANTRYYYRLRYKSVGASSFAATPEYSFHTQRAVGATFRFTIEADEHLYDKKGVRSLYQIALANQARDSADFMLSLGDTFGDDHEAATITSAEVDALHKDYLQYLGNVCHSLPFYFCLGNHEGENGYYLLQNPPNNLAVYGTLWRKYYYPNPFPNTFYSGNTIEEGHNMGKPENYYAWTWGDALFVVLDVYRHCDVNDKPQNWDWTLGRAQYDWLKQTLETSSARHKFVFAHHTRGQGRGGVATASGYEWGGYANGRWQFDTKRPGWAMPIHQLMVANGVKVFFQGHDHLYAKETLDGMVYQEVPMAADSTYEIGMLANADAYQGIQLRGSGHLRVTVAPNCVQIDFIRAYLPQDVNVNQQNGEIAYSYRVGNCVTSSQEAIPEASWTVFPNPVSDKVFVHTSTSGEQSIEIMNAQGQWVHKHSHSSQYAQLDVSSLQNGIYWLRWYNGRSYQVKKLVISH